MPTFTPPATNAVPPVLPPWSGREAQSTTAYRLFRHYRSRPEGINVYLLSDGTITENEPDGTRVVWSANDRTGDSINALYVEVAWYGGHDHYYVTDAQAALLEADGYTVLDDTPPFFTTWYGAPGTFGSVLPAYSDNAQGRPMQTTGVWESAYPVGQSVWFPKLGSDGTLVIPCQSQSGNVFNPTATSLQLTTWNPDDPGDLRVITVPTSTGSTHPISYSDAPMGGASFEGITRVNISGVGEAFVCTVGIPYADWSYATHGYYPTLAVFRKSGATYIYDEDLSGYAADILATNPSLGGVIWRQITTAITGEQIVNSRHACEIDTLPASGYMVMGHYDDATGISHNSGGISVVDPDGMVLKACYELPNVEYPIGHRLHVAPRNVRADPSSVDGDEQFTVTYDLFEPTPPGKPVGLICMGTGIGATTPDSAAWNVSGVMDMVCRVRLDDATPTAVQRLWGHFDGTSSQRSWAVNLNTNGTLAFIASSNGSSNAISQNSSAPALTDLTEYWLGVSINTAGGTNTLKFYKADGAAAMPTLWSGWTLISQHNSAAITFFNATCRLALGAQSTDSSSPFTGVIYRFALYDDGVLIADADYSPTASPLATISASTYTDSVGNVWTTGGGGEIAGTGRSFCQTYTFDGTDITPVTVPFAVTNPPSFIQRHDYDADGNLFVAVTTSLLANSTMKVFDSNTSAFANLPALDAAWLGGGYTQTTTQWGYLATPDHDVTGSAIGGAAMWMTWDDEAKVMYVPVGTSGVLAIGRTGDSPPYTYTYLGANGTYFNDAPGAGNITTASCIDPDRETLWLAVRQRFTGSYPPAAPVQFDQWVVGVATNFWE